MAKTKKEWIQGKIEELMQIADKATIKLKVYEIIEDMNKLVYNDNKTLISNEDKVIMLNQLIDALKKCRLIKEAQESEYFLGSVIDVMNYLKPAKEILEKEIERIETTIEVRNDNK
ncbi:MAG: hypothetical protein WCX96_04420 [Bacilli bacterium]